MTRHLLIVCFLVSLSLFADAQIGKGSLMVGGQIGYNTGITKSPDLTEVYESKNYGVSISLGKAIKENLFIGGELVTGFARSKQTTANFQKTTHKGAAVFIRKYFDIGKKFFIFGHGNTGVNFTDAESKYNSETVVTEGYNIYLGVSPRVSYAVNRKFHLEASLNSLFGANYTRGKTRRQAGVTVQRSFGVSTNLSNLQDLSIGLRFLFSR